MKECQGIIKWGWNKSPFAINSVVFHFDDFNYEDDHIHIVFDWIKIIAV
jgi:hypothetical protein